jgi:hypothetical protein
MANTTAILRELFRTRAGGRNTNPSVPPPYLPSGGPRNPPRPTGTPLW